MNPIGPLRRQAQLTQGELARRCGWSLRTQQRLEIDTPTWDQAVMLAGVLSASLQRPVHPQLDCYPRKEAPRAIPLSITLYNHTLDSQERS